MSLPIFFVLCYTVVCKSFLGGTRFAKVGKLVCMQYQMARKGNTSHAHDRDSKSKSQRRERSGRVVCEVIIFVFWHWGERPSTKV